MAQARRRFDLLEKAFASQRFRQLRLQDLDGDSTMMLQVGR